MKLKIGISLFVVLISLLYYSFWPQIFEFNKRDVIFEDGFYSKLPHEEFQWMRQNGKIVLINQGPEATQRIYLDTLPFAKERSLNLSLNGKYINTFTVAENGGTVYTLPQILRHGKNLLEVSANEKCTRVSEVLHNNDERCFTFTFRKIYTGS